MFLTMLDITKNPIIVGGVWTGGIDRVEIRISQGVRVRMQVKPDHVQFAYQEPRTYTERVVVGSYEEVIAQRGPEGAWAFTTQRVTAGEAATYSPGTYRRVHTVSNDLVSIISTGDAEAAEGEVLYLIPMAHGYEPHPIPRTEAYYEAMRHLNPHQPRPDGWVSPWPRGFESR